MKNIIEQFKALLAEPNYPCIGAKAAAKGELLNFIMADDLRSSKCDLTILYHIYQFIHDWRINSESLQTLVVIFNAPTLMTEVMFERLLWTRLLQLHYLDAKVSGCNASVDTAYLTTKFNFYFGEEAFFIVGMHPGSSRRARYFARPVLIFNLQKQFEKLQHEDIYSHLCKQIRARDCAYSGSVNPLIDAADFTDARGEQAVETEYSCPFAEKLKEAIVE
ncbi:guanitoxin biosynthesis heme-dependent pre-guanitoxin N-hydroxylase GntA [Legionella clemsonensis]|uniref:YqcI/YcgG family protein n=1 Tax=Legionella clemsonensis TaxID=1867846 RepID=A0A222NYY4_9GAMM|nr:guanitoxin biosynthesis heme-dependent pre-guanitoxin N-hydroxylase GntA [Legionella clemsonensis]ASQ44786.1 YqcI/YcgG family protein [Legionella clemsonensis]